MLRNRRIGFVGEGRSNDFLNAGFTRSRGENSWINAVARDDSENLRRLQIIDLTTAGGVSRAIARAPFATKPESRRLLRRCDLLSSLPGPVPRPFPLRRCRSFRIPAPCRSKLKHPRL